MIQYHQDTATVKGAQMAELQYKFKSDILFKILFVNNRDLLRSLVASALRIRKEDIKELTIANEAVLPELVAEKFCRLDLNTDSQ
jgi:hypothetical protein